LFQPDFSEKAATPTTGLSVPPFNERLEKVIRRSVVGRREDLAAGLFVTAVGATGETLVRRSTAGPPEDLR